MYLTCAGTAAGATTWEGDTIFVHEGTYVENVDVVKRVTLIGEGADVVAVRAGDAGDHVFEVTADWVNVSGFTVTGATVNWEAGIYLDSVNYCNISGNNASNNDCGILLYYSGSNTLRNNIINSNNVDGIRLWGSTNNMLQSNTATNNGYGIHMWKYSSNNTLQNNTANSNNWCGIRLDSSSNNTLTNNTANSNNDDGIHLYYSSNNTLASNTANSNNWYGICLLVSSNNTVYHNNLINNTYDNAYDSCTNQWDSSSEGNYYSDYTGTDSDSDGIGDTPCPIPGGGTSVDHSPLMQPWAGRHSTERRPQPRR